MAVRALVFLLLLIPVAISAQNMPREVGALVAFGAGQSSLTASTNGEGFYQAPLIEHIYFSFLSNGVQALSVFLEHVDETRSRNQLWTEFFFGGAQNNYPAAVSERLYMTTIGLETYRTLVSESGLRVAGGIGIGYGLGNATIDVTNKNTNVTGSATSCNAWSGLILAVSLRLRYSVYVTPKYDFGIIALGRYWGFPTIGPIEECFQTYSGPSTRVLNELGYLAGVSVGF